MRARSAVCLNLCNPTDCNLGFPCGSAGKESTCSGGDLGSIPGLGRSPGEGKGYPPQDSGLENSMGCIVHGVAKSQTQLNDFHFQSFLLLNHLVNFWLMIKCSVTTKAQQEEKIYFPKGICYLQRIEGT